MAAHEEIQSIVDRYTFHRDAYLRGQILDLNTWLPDSSLDHEKTLFQRQVEAADAAIDNLVYGLTEEEIGIIEKTK